MIVLDTNVLSEFMLSSPNSNVVQWFDQTHPSDIWTTSITCYEIHYGIEVQAQARRRDALKNAFEKMLSLMQQRVLSLDMESARLAAEISAKQKKSGLTSDIRDVMISGIVKHDSATLATRNMKHFMDAGIELINPWLHA